MAGKEAPLTFDKYQEGAEETVFYPNKGSNLVLPSLGLIGEAGEVSKIVAEVIRDKRGKISKEDRERLEQELGDVMWYLSSLATELGLSLEDIARRNLEKLASRKERGMLRGSGDDR